MSIEDTISRPYAKAIFEIAIENNSIEKWKKILFIINEITSNNKVKIFLSGSISPKFLSSIFINIGDDFFDVHAKNFIRLLSKNIRLKLINHILIQFLELEKCYKNITTVKLISAVFLKKEQIDTIKKKLESFFLKNIQLKYSIDNSLLCGMIIKFDDTILDLSMRNDLEQLSDFLNL